MTDARHPRAAAWVEALALIACTGIALVNLPGRELPPGWLVAFTAPAALLGRLPRATGPWRRVVFATLLQTTACWLALEHAGMLSRPAALACTILPPLAFVTARQQDSDASLGLFLSFCVLLVGIILDGIRAPLVAGYGTVACIALRCSAHLAAADASRTSMPLEPAPRRLLSLLGSSLAIALPCLAAAFAVERTLGVLPSPSRASSSATADDPRGRRRGVGLSDSFVLDGGGSVLSDLHGEQLVRVRTGDGAAVPPDLYLRSGFFAVPGLDRWQLGELEQAPVPSDAAHVVRRPLPRAEVVWLELERFAGARNFVFVPPGTVEIRGVGDLVVDPVREWLRQPDGSPQHPYEVGYQRLPAPPDDLPVDPRGRRLGLLTVPAGMELQPFAALLAEWRASSLPMRGAADIAAGLAQRCRYDRAEPTGPFPHALQNFLFADGDRRGYCMHFASAAALLLRLRGIPCRIGVGLFGGDPDRQEAGARIYGSQHAHAWVEIPFAGRGYVVFDPTPPAERGRRTPMRNDPGEANAGGAIPAARGPADPLGALITFVTQPWLLLLVLLTAIASTLRPAGTSRPIAHATPPLAVNARRLLAKLLRALAEAGHPRLRGETLELFARRIGAGQRLLPEVRAAFTAYQEVRFGGRAFDAPRQQVLHRGIKAAARMLPLSSEADAAGPARS